MSRGQRYRLIIAPTARRQLAETLPEAVANASYEFVVGPLLDNPYRVGKQLQAPLADRRSARRGTYRVIHRIDDQQLAVTVLTIIHRRDAYRRWTSSRTPVPTTSPSPAATTTMRHRDKTGGRS